MMSTLLLGKGMLFTHMLNKFKPVFRYIPWPGVFAPDPDRICKIRVVPGKGLDREPAGIVDIGQ